MKTERMFLIAPSLVRLILKERLVSKQVVEGYLAPASERTHFVRLEPSGCNLVLQSWSAEGASEQRTKVPSTQAEALLEVCPARSPTGARISGSRPAPRRCSTASRNRMRSISSPSSSSTRPRPRRSHRRAGSVRR